MWFRRGKKLKVCNHYIISEYLFCWILLSGKDFLGIVRGGIYISCYFNIFRLSYSTWNIISALMLATLVKMDMYGSGSGLPQSIGTCHDQHILRPAVVEHIEATIQIRANVASIVSTQTIWNYLLVERHKHVGFNPHLWHNTVMHISTDNVIGSFGRSICILW